MNSRISNSVTTQGFDNDVESNFTINNLIDEKFTYEQLRGLVAIDSYCQKVVSYLPETMGGVEFEVRASVNKRSRNINDTLSWINNCIKPLIPWFVETQIQANIVGKAYLVFDVHSAIISKNVNENKKYFPLVEAINYQANNTLEKNVKFITPLKIISIDKYRWSDDNNFLIKIHSGVDGFHYSSTNKEYQINKWVTEKTYKYKNNLQKIESLQYEIIESSHIIEFTAFDYQDDSHNVQNNSRKSIQETALLSNNLENVSFRLIRFLPSLLRYLSFLNATLNRMHRSEAVIYKKNDLGETNQAIAKFVSQTSDNQLIPNVTELIKEELKTLRDSLKNFGVALIDKKNEIEMISRSMAGIDNLDNVFSKDLIASSKLTEYSLFGMNSQGAGLASLDIRDRMAIAKQTDELFANHWKPQLLYLATCLGEGSGKIIQGIHDLYIFQSPSFTLSQLEASEWLEKRINILINLKNAGIIDNLTILNELSGNSELGQYFSLNNADVARLTAIQ